MKYIVYGRSSGCTFCDQAKNLLVIKDVDFDFLEVGVDVTREELISTVTSMGQPSPRTVPQIIRVSDDGSQHYVGGFVELKKELG